MYYSSGRRNPAYKQVALASQKRKESSFFDKQNALLAVSLAHLDAEAEMRRFFGSKVVRLLNLSLYFAYLRGVGRFNGIAT